MDLSTPAGLETLARDVAQQLGAHRTEQDGAPDRVQIIFADGRTLELVPNRPRTRITITAVLPGEAAAQDLAIEPITVTALPRPRPSETQDKATARHTADHIRRRLLPQQTAVASRLSATVERARTALSALPDHRDQRWAVSDLPVPHPLGLDRTCHIAWWHTPTGESRAVAPFLADLLRRAGLATTEPHGSALVFFADPPAQPDARFHVAPACGRDGWDLVDQFTGAVVRTYDDAEWARQIAASANGQDEAARRAGTPSPDLPGLSGDLIEMERARHMAVELAMAGHMPYGLVEVDYTQTPGFLIYPGPQPSVVRVARLLEPWGSIRPGARFEAPKREVERYDTELEAYARLLNGPGRSVAVQLDGIQVTFSAPPSRP